MGFRHICFTAFAVYLLFFLGRMGINLRHKFDASCSKTGILWIWKRVINGWKQELHYIFDPKGIYLAP